MKGLGVDLTVSGIKRPDLGFSPAGFLKDKTRVAVNEAGLEYIQMARSIQDRRGPVFEAGDVE